MNTVPREEFKLFLQHAAYVPRNLIIFVTEMVNPLDNLFGTPPSESEVNLQAAIKVMFEMHVLKTRIKATENHHRMLDNDEQKEYSQDFIFNEKCGKVCYTTMRRWRAHGAATFRLVMLEPDPTFTKVLDAWAMQDCKIDQIRNDAVPVRDLTKGGEVTDREGEVGTPIRTTVSVKGHLIHHLSVMDEAQILMDKMSMAGMNPSTTSLISLKGDVDTQNS